MYLLSSLLSRGRGWWLLMGWLWGSIPLAAQSDATPCGALLDELLLRQAYPDSVIDALQPDNPCWDVFTPAEQVRAYRLLTEAHLLQIPPDAQAAAEAWRALLRIAPEYNLAQNQGSEELLRVARRFDHRPWRSVEVLMGGHAPLLRPWGQQSAAQRRNPDDFAEATRSPLASFEAGAGLWYNLNAHFVQWPRLRRWEVGGRALYRVSRYRYDERLATSPAAAGQEDFARLTFHETQQWAILALQVRHHFDPRAFAYQSVRRLSPYLHAGVEGGWLWQARFSQASRQAALFAPDGSVEELLGQQRGLVQTNAGPLRRDLALWALAGLGMTYKWDTEYLALELGYAWGLTNLVNPNQRFANPEMAFRFGYVDPDWNLHRLTLTLSYWLPTYRTRLKPQFRA